MIVVDSSVWIAHFRNEACPAVAALRNENPSAIVVGDLVLLECLQGARDERHATQIESTLTAFTLEPMMSPQLAIDAAQNYHSLRALGLTPRKTIDTIIATFCIKHGHRLLHQDRDFDPMAAHSGLKVAL